MLSRRLSTIIAVALVFLPILSVTADERRTAISTPEQTDPDLFLYLYRLAMEPDARFAAHLRDTLGDELIDSLPGAAAQQTTDGLAHDVAAGMAGMISASQQWNYLRSLMGIGALTREMGHAATHNIHMPDGSVLTYPASKATELQVAVTGAAARELVSRGQAPNLTGTYTLSTQGTCPVESGTIALSQTDNFVHGARGRIDLIAGAVHPGGGWFIANEKMFATMRLDNGGRPTSIEVPDRPSYIFKADTVGNPLILHAQDPEACTLTLTRAG